MTEIQKFIHHPKYITQLKDVRGNPEDDSYAIDYHELSEILNKTCTELRLPATILNTNYPIKKAESYYESIRVESAASLFSLRAPCRNLRVAASSNGINACYECDYYYALQLKNQIEGSNVQVEVPSIIGEHIIPIIEHHDGVAYIHYNCEMLGYCELCFAIKVYDTVLGVLFVGNTILNDQENYSKREQIRRTFIDRQYNQNGNGVFRGYDRKTIDNYIFKEPDYEDILPPLKDDGLHQQIWEDYRMPRTIDELKDYIKICCEKVKRIEREIQRSWENRQRTFFRAQVESAKANFELKYKALREKENISYNDIQELYETIWDFSLELKEKYKLDYCRLYDNLPFITGSFYAEQFYLEGKKKGRIKIGLCPYEKKDPKTGIPDFTAIKKDFSKANLNSFECKTSLKDYSSENNPLLCFSVQGKPLAGENEVVLACSNLAVIFGLEDHRYKKDYGILFEEIANVFSLICSKLQELSTAFLKYKYYSTLTLYKHECVHYAKRIQSRNRIFYDREWYEFLSDEKKAHIYGDLTSVAKALTTLSDNISVLLNDDLKRYSYLKNDYYELNEAINKWNAFYRLPLAVDAKRIIKSTPQIDRHRRIKTNSALFDTLLLNIIDNAIKYSYFGTAIDIALIEDKGAIQLRITDYGTEIEESARPYDLFYRAETEANYIVGDGIGLYTSKKISSILGLKLTHTCVKLYDYHVPFLFAAKTRGMNLGEHYSEIQEQFQELYQKGDLEYILVDCINGNCKLPPPKQIIDQIERPIYKVTFVIDGLERK